jgi:hypothetical protein
MALRVLAPGWLAIRSVPDLSITADMRYRTRWAGRPTSILYLSWVESTQDHSACWNGKPCERRARFISRIGFTAVRTAKFRSGWIKDFWSPICYRGSRRTLIEGNVLSDFAKSRSASRVRMRLRRVGDALSKRQGFIYHYFRSAKRVWAELDDFTERKMNCLRQSALTMLLLLSAPAIGAPNDPIRVELNLAEAAQSKCRMSFVIENKGETPIGSLQLDLAFFNRDGILQNRSVAEMGPVARSKTIVRSFEFEGECDKLGSILINDITACSPGDPGSCLDRLALSSRVKSITLFK